MGLFSKEPDIDKLKARKDVKGLIKALQDSFFVGRDNAADALGELGNHEAVMPLISALKDRQRMVRSSSARALGKIGDKRAIEPLIESYQDEDSYVRVMAAEALTKIPRGITAFRQSNKSIKPLIDSLRDERSYKRAMASRALGLIGDPGAVDGLIEALGDSDEYVRREAIEALGKIGNERAVDGLIKALGDRDEYVCKKAIEALVKIGNERAVDGLIKALNDGDKDVREKAIEALGKIGDSRAVKGLIKALNDEDSEVRRIAVKALIEIGDPGAVGALERAIEDFGEEWGDEIREEAEEALKKIKSSDAYKEYLERRRDQLHVSIVTDSGFKVGRWQELCATVMNAGESELKNVKLATSGEVEVGPVKPLSVLKRGERREMMLGIKPAEYGNLPLNIKISYMDENDIPIEINDVVYINVAKESEKVSVHPQSIFNIGSIGEVLGVGAIKTGDIGMVKGGIGSTEKPFTKCPYCGEELNLPKTPKFCPYCGEQLT